MTNENRVLIFTWKCADVSIVNFNCVGVDSEEK